MCIYSSANCGYTHTIQVTLLLLHNFFYGSSYILMLNFKQSEQWTLLKNAGPLLTLY